MLRPCLICSTLSRESRCESHRLERPSATERGYGSSWRRLSASVIAEYGSCVDCGHAGSPDNPLTADHIVAKANGGTDDRWNLTCRCRRHNSSKGAR